MISELIFENDNYQVSFTDRASPHVTVVFSSAGALAVAQPIEEFKKTISEFTTSYIFVRSLYTDWYNNVNSIRTFRFVADFCKKFDKIYVMGESLGGSGSILFADYCDNIHRILAFSPQYSAVEEFCKWGGPLTPLDGAFARFTFSDYSSEFALGKSVLIYASTLNEDNMHARFFKSEGFDVVFLKSSDHAIAKWLKERPKINYLHLVLWAFYHDDFDFTARGYMKLLEPIVQKYYKPYVKFIGYKTEHHTAYIDIPDKKLLSEGKVATQSSVGEYSTVQDVQGEATRALTEVLTPHPNTHTEKENFPWWCVDLGAESAITHIIIYNRGDTEEYCRRLSDFSILISSDGKIWREIYRKKDTSIVGGCYGRPFFLEQRMQARFVKIRLNGFEYLHLSRVEVYGD